MKLINKVAGLSMSRALKGFLVCVAAWILISILVGLFEFGPSKPMTTNNFEWSQVGEWGFTVTVRAFIDKDIPDELSIDDLTPKLVSLASRVQP